MLRLAPGIGERRSRALIAFILNEIKVGEGGFQDSVPAGTVIELKFNSASL